MSITDTIVNMNIPEDQQNALIQNSAVLLDNVAASTATVIEELLISNNITLDMTTSTITTREST